MTSSNHCDDQPVGQTAHNVDDDLNTRNDTTRHDDSRPEDLARSIKKLAFVPPVLETEPFHRDSLTGAAAIEIQTADNESGKPFAETERPDKSMRSRREVLRHGGKLAFAAPILSTFYASQAYAANYSCYAEGHTCAGAEPCCEDLSCNGGFCSEFCVSTGDPCFTDADCCSSDCRVGSCQ